MFLFPKVICTITPAEGGTQNIFQNGQTKKYPIKSLYYAGVPVTINTDDLLIFNQSVSEEYLNLYSSGALNAEALNTIRLTGLNQTNYFA